MLDRLFSALSLRRFVILDSLLGRFWSFHQYDGSLYQFLFHFYRRNRRCPYLMMDFMKSSQTDWRVTLGVGSLCLNLGLRPLRVVGRNISGGVWLRYASPYDV